MKINLSDEDVERLKLSRARYLAGLLMNDGLADLWTDDEIVEYLEADGYSWIDGEWRNDVDVDLVAAL